MLVLTTLLWGTTFSITKTGLADASPLSFLSLRFFLASLVGAVVWWSRLRKVSRNALSHGVILGVFMFGGYGSQTFGLAYTTVAKSGLFTYTYALLVPGLQYLLVRKPVSVGNLFGLAIVVAGMILFTHPAQGVLNLGDWVTLGGAGLFAFYVVLVDRYSSHDDPIHLTLIQFVTTAVLAGLSAVWLEPGGSVVVSGRLLFTLGYLAVAGSVIAVYIMNRFQRESTPTRAVLIYALEPVFTVAFGYLILRESLEREQFLGGALILAGVIVSELWRLRPSKRVGASESGRLARGD